MHFEKIWDSNFTPFQGPKQQTLLHLGVIDNQISLNFKVSNNCSINYSGGVRQSMSLANGSNPQTEEHWGFLHKLRSTTILYIVQLTLYTVHCTLFTVHFSHPKFSHNF